MLNLALRDDVFVAGGQPSITYVKRDDQHVERSFARAIATPNQVISLSGPSKSGKTVLCRKTLSEREFLWVDGGQIKTVDQFWGRVAHELNLPLETTETVTNQTSGTATAKVPLLATAGGSQLRQRSVATRRAVNSMADSIARLQSEKIILVIDDFHYLEEGQRKEIVRNLKNAVFGGLKIVLLSVTHRAFDAIKAESELTGRFVSIVLPKWSAADLQKIAFAGFEELRICCPEKLIKTFCREAQESPFLMQRFCWEMCFDNEIDRAALPLTSHSIPDTYNPTAMFKRLAEDAGLPIYRTLAAGPQSRRARAKRPLKSGKEADIYEVTLLAIAHTGPKSEITYEELRAALTQLLAASVPQKHEITAALKHLVNISRKSGIETAVDYDEDNRTINVVDPYLRFFLRWQIKLEAPDISTETLPFGT